jgi:hypothetical protein
MPFSIFVALSILGLDFMIYVLFKLLYGDRRSAIARQVAAQRKSLGEATPRPFLVSSREGTARLGRQALRRTVPDRSTNMRQEDRTQESRLIRSAS